MADSALSTGLAKRVERALRRGNPQATLLSFEALAGGHSGVSHVAEVVSGAEHRRVVVRSSPPGRAPVGRHDVIRQAQVMAALERVPRVPVPRIHAVDESADEAFFVAEYVAGVAHEPVIEPARPAESVDGVAACWRRAIETLAALHSVDATDVGLDEPARTPVGELENWTATFAASRFEYPARDALLADLRRWAPPPRSDGRATIVHGDFRLGNLMIERTRPLALIDWEIWTVGQPLVDLSWFVLFTDPENFPGIGRSVPGTPTTDAVVERYLELSGTPGDGIEWYLALGAFKLAAIQAHNQRRHLDGRHHDPYQELLGPSITRLLDAAGERLAMLRSATSRP